MSKVDILSLWPGPGLFERQLMSVLGDRVRSIHAFEDDPQAAKMFHRVTGLPITYDPEFKMARWVKPDIVVCQPRIAYRTWKDTEADQEDQLKTLVTLKIIREVSKNARWSLAQLPVKAETYMAGKGVDLPYTILQYADYGLPQRRKRLIVGTWPLPGRTHSKFVWKKVPEIADISPTLTTTEWNWSKKDRFRANRKWGRLLRLEDIKFPHGVLGDLYEEDLRRGESNRLMSLVVHAIPESIARVFSKSLLQAMSR